MENIELKTAILFRNRDEWRTWLEKNHLKKEEIWLIHYKKSSRKKSINHISAALDHAIMHMDMDQVTLTQYTEDLKEGVSAFFEKRQGKYKGN